ncbi:hypothetical protein L1987_57801 [Smallanthus sonchifolius]|uniref:Uncharacterized protein n=1 Tax=Smallanthus sonchifolius TaxID=185202 RepID=A0ACB9DE06_9ASTR|nr:hypothetical protein L1987_57801 [Smallanthus sonchifolius]
MNHYRNLDEVRNRALRKSESSSFKTHRSKPYSRADNHRINVMEDDEEEENYPKLTDYCFPDDVSELMYVMQDLGDKARWPRKTDKGSGWKDKSKWCAYHEDFWHMTEDCIALRKEISYLLSKGHLKELLGRKKEKNRNPDVTLRRAASPPKDAKVINFISGGSDICGTSYSATKRHAKEAKTEKEDRPTRTSTVTDQKVISFDEEDRDNVQDPHHDGLVITLYIANHFVRRILIDGGSSVNIIQLEALKRMNIPETEIISKSSVLVGFSGEVKNIVGEIKLPVYIDGINSIQNFCIIDSVSCYNIILGRPWIHDMKAVPSTYHQCVKLPTPWGVVKIDSDHQEAKDCYTSSMKASAKTR